MSSFADAPLNRGEIYKEEESYETGTKDHLFRFSVILAISLLPIALAADTQLWTDFAVAVTPVGSNYDITAEMKTQATFAGWASDSIWGINENTTYCSMPERRERNDHKNA